MKKSQAAPGIILAGGYVLAVFGLMAYHKVKSLAQRRKLQASTSPAANLTPEIWGAMADKK